MAIYVALINGMGYGEDSDGGELQNIVGAQDADFMYMGNDFINGAGVSDYTTGGLKVEAIGTPDNTVNVAVGGVYIENSSGAANSKNTRLWKLYSTSVVNLTIPANVSGNPRIDLIVAKVDKNTDPGQQGELAGTIEVVQGTPAPAPVAPAVPSDSYALASVAVANSFTTITSGNISDLRNQAVIKSESIIDQVYPIGSVYTSVNNTNPGTIFGGTWEAFGAGRTLVGYNGSDSDFNASEKTGGAKTHTHQVPSPVGYISQSPFIFSAGDFGNILTSYGASSSVSIQNRTRSAAGTSSTGNTEVWRINSTASSSLQPYITVFFWKRTA